MKKMKLKRGLSFFLAMTILMTNIGTSIVVAEETDITTDVETELETEEYKLEDIILETETSEEIQNDIEEIADEQEKTDSIYMEPEETDSVQEETEDFISIPEQSQETEVEETETDSDCQSEIQEEEKQVLQNFCQSVVCDGVRIIVSATEGVFPENSNLRVKKISGTKEQIVTDMVSANNVNVARSYTFDIKVLDAYGNEIQPDAAFGLAEISFSPAEMCDPNVEPVVYHISEDKKVQELAVTEEDGELLVSTDGFSIFQLDFIYGMLQYQVSADEPAELSAILSAVGLTGNVESAVSGNEKYLSVTETGDGFIVNALQHFDTEEELTVVINGLEYVILVITTVPEGINVVLYKDGTLVFQNSGDEFTSEHGEVEKRYAYDEMNPVWNSNNAVLRVEFRTSIQPTHMNNWFQNCSRLQEFSFDGAGMNPIEDMSGIFANCTSLTSVVLKNITVERNTAFASRMFFGCSALTTVDLSGWKVGRLDLDRLVFPETFSGCGNLRYLYMKKWNLPYSYSIEEVLGGYSSISGLRNTHLLFLDVSEWNLPQCRFMTDAFSYLDVERINVTGMHIPIVTNGIGLFQYDRNLKQIDGLEDLRFTSADVDITSMFQLCESLESITLHNVNVKNATSIAKACKNLKYVKFSGWQVKNITDISSLFDYCVSLKIVDLPEWIFDGDSLDDLGSKIGITTYARDIVLLNMRDWTLTAKNISAKGIFRQMKLKYLILSGWNTEHVISLEEMCANCLELEIIDLSGWNTSSVRSYKAMFGQCESIVQLDLHLFDMSAAEDIKYMFMNCYSLQELDISTWIVNPGIAFDRSLQGCNSLSRMKISGNNMTDAQYNSASAGKLSALKEISVDEISGAPVFLSEIQTSWYDKKNREYEIGDVTITEEVTLHRDRTEYEQQESLPERTDKEQYQVDISVKTLLDQKEIFKEVPYTLSIYDEDHNWICTGTSDKTFSGPFEEGKNYQIEIQQQNQANFFVDISGDYFVFQRDMQRQELIITYRSRADVTVTKTWNDNEDEGRNRPGMLEVTLYKNGDPIDTQYLSDENNWTYTWSDLYRYDESDDGKIENIWEVKETVPPGYVEEYVHVQTEKDIATDFVSLEIIKMWNDYSNVMNQRSPVTFRLFRGMKENKEDAIEIDNRTYEWFDENIYTTGWYNLPAYDENGNQYYYFITEDDMPLYHSRMYVSGKQFRFQNDYTDMETVTVAKRWSENPDNITSIIVGIEGYVGEKNIGVLANVQLSGRETDLNAKNGWKMSVSVPKYTVSGERITSYEVKEYPDSFISSKKIEGRYQPYYMKSGNEYIILNKYLPIQQAPVDSSQDSTDSSGDGDEDSGNTNIHKKGYFSICKRWNDGDDFDHIRPDFVEIELYQNERLYDTFILSETNEWKQDIGELPINDDSGKHSYRFREKDVPKGYSSAVTMNIRGENEYAYTVTNTHIPSPNPDYEIRKIWNDKENENGYRPTGIEVELYAGNRLLDTYILTEENEWKQNLGELPQTDDNGNKIIYTVREKEVPIHYLATYEYSSTKHDLYYTTHCLNIVNTEVSKVADIDWGITNTPKRVDICVRKFWDVSREYDLSDKTIFVQLFRQTAVADDSEEMVYGDIQPVDNPVELNAENEWTYIWKSKLEYMNGHPVKYSVNEVDETGTVVTPEGFIKTISAETDEDGFYMITNTSTKVEFEKTDLDGKLLDGAHLQILQGNDIIAEWDTVKGEKKLLEGILLPNATYTLHESDAPDGYALADDITFTVRADGIPQTIIMKDESLARLPLTGGSGNRTPWHIPFFCTLMLLLVSTMMKKEMR